MLEGYLGLCYTSVMEVLAKIVNGLMFTILDVAYLVLNKCMKRSTYLPNDSEEYKVQFFYDLVDDTYSNWSHDDIDEESKSVNTTASKVTVTSEQEDVNKLTPEIIRLMEKKETHPLSIMVSRDRSHQKTSFQEMPRKSVFNEVQSE